MDIKKLENTISEALEENPTLFLVDFLFSQGNIIKVIIDGDNGVPLKECVRISRAVEGVFDREIEDYALEVTTPDITLPLKNKRQYIKNKERILLVRDQQNEKFEGKLIQILDKEIVLEWKAREPKPVGKGKITVVKQKTIAYEDIAEAKVKILF